MICIRKHGCFPRKICHIRFLVRRTTERVQNFNIDQSLNSSYLRVHAGPPHVPHRYCFNHMNRNQSQTWGKYSLDAKTSIVDSITPTLSATVAALSAAIQSVREVFSIDARALWMSSSILTNRCSILAPNTSNFSPMWHVSCDTPELLPAPDHGVRA